jgi:hypothetical protein
MIWVLDAAFMSSFSWLKWIEPSQSVRHSATTLRHGDWFESSAAQRVHDLYAITIDQQALAMEAFRHDLAIDFHRDFAPGVASAVEQIENAGSGRHLMSLAIEQDGRHAAIVTSDGEIMCATRRGDSALR